MDQLSAALRGIIGKAPTYMRSPYFASNDFTLSVLRDLNFHVVHASIDTLDWQNDSQDAIGISVQNFKNGLNNGGTIELSHDVHQWTANTLVQEMINELKARGLRGMITLLKFIFICLSLSQMRQPYSSPFPLDFTEFSFLPFQARCDII